MEGCVKPLDAEWYTMEVGGGKREGVSEERREVKGTIDETTTTTTAITL
jgi:hypothetical protein